MPSVRKSTSRALLLAALTPLALAAQQSVRKDSTAAPASGDAQVHVVKPHDTLWDIAKAYLGDPFQWPEIYRANRDVVEDPHWIHPGERLRIPGRQQVAAAAAPDTTPAPVAAPAEEPVPQGPTIFQRPTPAVSTSSATVMAAGEQVPPTVRPGEFLAAPFADQRGGPAHTGQIVGTTEVPGIAASADRLRMQPFEKVLIQTPGGVATTVGQRFVTYELGPLVYGIEQVVLPTGVLRVVKGAAAGQAATAEIEKVFREVHRDQRIMTYDTSVATVTARPQPVSSGPVGQVRWILNDPVLPSLQTYLILDLTTKQGLKLGDEVTFFLPGQAANVEMPVSKPEEVLGKGQVIRVTDEGATVMIVSQAQPKIEVGTRARVTAKMP